jgi:hypothetical protein
VSIQNITPNVYNKHVLVDATDEDVTLSLPRLQIRQLHKSGLDEATHTVTRADESAHTVTVSVPAGWTLNGTTPDR